MPSRARVCQYGRFFFRGTPSAPVRFHLANSIGG